MQDEFSYFGINKADVKSVNDVEEERTRSQISKKGEW
jgi:hypothetical protein